MNSLHSHSSFTPVSGCQHFADPPTLICHRLSAFVSTPFSPLAADIICERSINTAQYLEHTEHLHVSSIQKAHSRGESDMQIVSFLHDHG